MLQACTQLDELRSRLLVHLPFEFDESAAGDGAGKKASRKRNVEQKSASSSPLWYTDMLCARDFFDAVFDLVVTLEFSCVRV